MNTGVRRGEAIALHWAGLILTRSCCGIFGHPSFAVAGNIYKHVIRTDTALAIPGTGWPNPAGQFGCSSGQDDEVTGGANATLLHSQAK